MGKTGQTGGEKEWLTWPPLVPWRVCLPLPRAGCQDTRLTAYSGFHFHLLTAKFRVMSPSLFWAKFPSRTGDISSFSKHLLHTLMCHTRSPWALGSGASVCKGSRPVTVLAPLTSLT